MIGRVRLRRESKENKCAWAGRGTKGRAGRERKEKSRKEVKTYAWAGWE